MDKAIGRGVSELLYLPLRLPFQAGLMEEMSTCQPGRGGGEGLKAHTAHCLLRHILLREAPSWYRDNVTEASRIPLAHLCPIIKVHLAASTSTP